VFTWDDLRKILPGCQQMASVPNGVESRNIAGNFNRLNMAHERIQTDRRQTDGRRYSERVNASSRSLKNWAYKNLALLRCVRCVRALRKSFFVLAFLALCCVRCVRAVASQGERGEDGRPG